MHFRRVTQLPHHPELGASRARVALDLFADLADQGDDVLCMVIARSCLGCEQIGLRLHIHVRILQEHVVAADDAERVQQLALVLMHTLCLDDEERIRIDLDVLRRKDPVSHVLLIVTLDLRQALMHRLIVAETDKVLETLRVVTVSRTDALIDQGRQFRVGLAEPAAICDTVRDIGKLVRRCQIIIMEQVVFQQL